MFTTRSSLDITPMGLCKTDVIVMVSSNDFLFFTIFKYPYNIFWSYSYNFP